MSRPPKVKMPWGSRKTRVGAGKFRRFLKSIDNAERFLQDGWARVLYDCGRHTREIIFARIKEVDPNGLEEVKKYYRSFSTRRTRSHNRRKNAANRGMTEAEERAEIKKPLVFAQAPEADHYGKPKKYRMKSDGVVKYAALLLASGLSQERVAMEMGMDIEFIAQHVKQKDVQAARHSPILSRVAVIEADRKVVRDLVKDEVDRSTDIADKIATRRRTIEVEKSRMTSAGDFSDEERRAKEDGYKRFDKAKIVEAEVEDRQV